MTAVNHAAGALRIELGLLLGALLVAGWVAGDRIARRMSTTALRRAVAVALLAIGGWYAWDTLRG